MTENIHIEVAYATPESQRIIGLDVEDGTTAKQAVLRSGIEKYYPQAEIDSAPLGIFGNALGARGLPDASDYRLKDGDRIEIYRPLIADPKEVRKRRAAEAAQRRASEKAEKAQAENSEMTNTEAADTESRDGSDSAG